MTTRKIDVSFSGLLGLVFLSIGLASQSNGQCKDKGINGVSAEPSTRTVGLRFDIPVTSKDAIADEDKARWSVVAISPGAQTVRVETVELQSIGPGNMFQTAELTYTGTFQAGKKYLLYVENLTFNGCNPQKEAFAMISVASTPAPAATPAPEPSAYGIEKANGRNDADIYVSGGIEGVRREKAVKTIDLKFELPIPVRVFQNDQLIIPYIDLKASSNAKADADSLKIGAILRTAFNLPQSRFSKIVSGMVWDLDGRIEGNKNLRFINGIVANKFSFVTKTIGDGDVQFYIQPFVGLEVGRNLKTPVVDAIDQPIVRPNFGASAFLNIWIEKPLLNTISIQSEFIRRWSLAREVGVNKDGDNYVPVFAGKGPRDYVLTKVELGFNDYVGFAVGHEYGRLPPNFKFLDHKFTVGLVFKSKLIFRPK